MTNSKGGLTQMLIMGHRTNNVFNDFYSNAIWRGVNLKMLLYIIDRPGMELQDLQRFLVEFLNDMAGRTTQFQTALKKAHSMSEAVSADRMMMYDCQISIRNEVLALNNIIARAIAYAHPIQPAILHTTQETIIGDQPFIVTYKHLLMRDFDRKRPSLAELKHGSMEFKIRAHPEQDVTRDPAKYSYQHYPYPMYPIEQRGGIEDSDIAGAGAPRRDRVSTAVHATLPVTRTSAVGHPISPYIKPVIERGVGGVEQDMDIETFDHEDKGGEEDYGDEGVFEVQSSRVEGQRSEVEGQRSEVEGQSPEIEARVGAQPEEKQINSMVRSAAPISVSSGARLLTTMASASLLPLPLLSIQKLVSKKPAAAAAAKRGIEHSYRRSITSITAPIPISPALRTRAPTISSKPYDPIRDIEIPIDRKTMVSSQPTAHGEGEMGAGLEKGIVMVPAVGFLARRKDEPEMMPRQKYGEAGQAEQTLIVMGRSPEGAAGEISPSLPEKSRAEMANVLQKPQAPSYRPQVLPIHLDPRRAQIGSTDRDARTPPAYKPREPLETSDRPVVGMLGREAEGGEGRPPLPPILAVPNISKGDVPNAADVPLESTSPPLGVGPTGAMATPVDLERSSRGVVRVTKHDVGIGDGIGALDRLQGALLKEFAAVSAITPKRSMSQSMYPSRYLKTPIKTSEIHEPKTVLPYSELSKKPQYNLQKPKTVEGTGEAGSEMMLGVEWGYEGATVDTSAASAKLEKQFISGAEATRITSIDEIREVTGTALGTMALLTRPMTEAIKVLAPRLVHRTPQTPSSDPISTLQYEAVHMCTPASHSIPGEIPSQPGRTPTLMSIPRFDLTNGARSSAYSTPIFPAYGSLTGLSKTDAVQGSGASPGTPLPNADATAMSLQPRVLTDTTPAISQRFEQLNYTIAMLNSKIADIERNAREQRVNYSKLEKERGLKGEGDIDSKIDTAFDNKTGSRRFQEQLYDIWLESLKKDIIRHGGIE